jgi:N-acetylglucosamine kinase-like BadF-type ATPase
MDGMAERTLLYELVTAKVGDSVSDIVDKVYKSDTGYVASFASAVFEAYGKGDETAASILHSNARALADIINYGKAHYDCGNKLVLSGGIVMKDDGFVDILRQYVNPLLQITIPKYHQVLGACVLCAELCGVNTDGFIEKLAKQY